MKRLKVLLPDLTCANCVREIELVMRQQKGVIWATVNFAARDAKIIYDPAVFSATQFMRAIDQLGHKARFDNEPVRQTQKKPSKPKLLLDWMQQQVRALSR
jgi:copper chaperone CopZ